MKLRERKTRNACRVMESFGIKPSKTKTALKGLLKLYDNNWELIQDENFKVLFDVLMPEEEIRVKPKDKETLILESKGMKRSQQTAPVHVKTEASELPMKRLFTGQEEKHASSSSKSSLDPNPSRSAHQIDCGSGASQPLLRRTRVRCQEVAFIRESKAWKSKKEAPPDNNIEVIELPTKRLYTRQQKKQALFLSKSCMDVTPSTSTHQGDDDIFSDSEEAKPPVKRCRLRGQEGEAMIFSSKGEIYNNIKSPSNGKTEVVELPTSTYTREHKKQASSLLKSCRETSLSTMAHQNDGIIFYDSEESEETPLISRRNRARHQKKGVLVPGNNLVSGIPPPAKGNIVICLDSSSDSDVCIVDEGRLEALDVEPLTVENKDLSNMSETDDDGDSLEVLKAEPLIVDSRGHDFDSPRVDIGSSLSQEEVNISLTCNYFPQSDTCFPIMEVVEERGKSGNISGTDSITDDNGRFREVPQLENSMSHDVLAMKDDYQGSNCSAPGFHSEVFVFQNLFKIVPHIPRHIDLCRFGCLHSLIGFPFMDIEKVFDTSGKRLQVLPGLKFSKVHEVETAQSHQNSQIVKFCVYVDDITRGEEKMKIPLEGGRNAEDLSKFFYIPQNVVYKDAHVNFALHCTSNQACCSHCFGNCLASLVPCACAVQTGGGFAYTPNGTLKNTFLDECLSAIHERKQHHYFCCTMCPLESFRKKSSNACQGHLIQKFIKECWSKCGCNKNCGNRVIQQGIFVNLQVFLTPDGKGWGLRTLDDLPRGAFVCEYVGEIVTSTELFERNMQSSGRKHTYTVLLDANWSSKGVLKDDDEALFLDAAVYGNVARFINHRCSDATLVSIPVEVETPGHHYYHVALFTTRKVAAMEELTWDYGVDFVDHDHPVKPFHCLCGSQFCRGSDFKVQA